MFSDFQDNCIFRSPSRQSFGLYQYSNSPVMVYWNLYRVSYSVAFWGETRWDFTLDKKLWEDSEDSEGEGCAPTQMKLSCQAAWVTKNFGDFLRHCKKSTGTVNLHITENIYLSKLYKEVQFGLIENSCIQLAKGKKSDFGQNINP